MAPKRPYKSVDAERIENLTRNYDPARDGPLKDKVYRTLRSTRRQWTVDGLADYFDVGPGKIRESLERLVGEGKNVRVSDKVEIPPDVPRDETPTRIDVNKLRGKRYQFGLTADNHLCSRYYRADVLNALFDIWSQQGIEVVYQCGNMIDGECRFNRYDLVTRSGVEAQAEYFVNEWPQRKNMRTEFITGHDHEGWYVKSAGLDIGRYLQSAADLAGRKDIRFLNHMEHDIEFRGKNGSSTLRLIHAGGGSAYATSYKAQKIVESYQGGTKPQVLCIGHYHKAEFGYPREVRVLQCGATQDQTPFLRQHEIQVHMGGWTVEFELDENGIINHFRQEWHQFYDREFYRRWDYKWN